MLPKTLPELDISGFKSLSLDGTGDGLQSTSQDLVTFHKALMEVKMKPHSLCSVSTLKRSKKNHKNRSSRDFDKTLNDIYADDPLRTDSSCISLRTLS